MCGRSFSDATQGWFANGVAKATAWSPLLKCANGVSLMDALEIEGGKSLRKLEVGELLEALEAPAKDPKAEVLRVRVRAEKDGTVGFVTMKGKEGTTYVKSAQ